MTPERDCDEFVCTGCGRRVISVPPIDPPPTRCGACQYIDEFVADPVEREELRQRVCR
jgi:hypothetical protein